MIYPLRTKHRGLVTIILKIHIISKAHLHDFVSGLQSLYCVTIPSISQSRILQSLSICLLYTSDAADDKPSVDLGGRRIIKKIFFKQKTAYEIPLRLVGSEMCIRDR